MSKKHRFKIYAENGDDFVTVTRDDGEVFIFRSEQDAGGSSIYSKTDGDGSGVHMDVTVPNAFEHSLVLVDGFSRDQDGRGVWPSIN